MQQNTYELCVYLLIIMIKNVYFVICFILFILFERFSLLGHINLFQVNFADIKTELTIEQENFGAFVKRLEREESVGGFGGLKQITFAVTSRIAITIVVLHDLVVDVGVHVDDAFASTFQGHEEEVGDGGGRRAAVRVEHVSGDEVGHSWYGCEPRDEKVRRAFKFQGWLKHTSKIVFCTPTTGLQEF